MFLQPLLLDFRVLSHLMKLYYRFYQCLSATISLTACAVLTAGNALFVT